MISHPAHYTSGMLPQAACPIPSRAGRPYKSAVLAMSKASIKGLYTLYLPAGIKESAKAAKGQGYFVFLLTGRAFGSELITAMSIEAKEIEYVVGDAVYPDWGGEGAGYAILHVCNTVGLWGRGFVTSVSKRFGNATHPRSPESLYRSALQGMDEGAVLGTCHYVSVDDDRFEDLDAKDTPQSFVVNMIAQIGVRSAKNTQPLSYMVLEECLASVKDFVIGRKLEVHMPRIGAGLAGGNWTRIKKIIKEQLCNYGVRVVVYDWQEHVELTQDLVEVGQVFQSLRHPHMNYEIIAINKDSVIIKAKGYKAAQITRSSLFNLYRHRYTIG